MHKLTLFILALLLTAIPSSGQAQSDAIPIAPCLNLIGTPATMTLDPVDTFYANFEVKDQPVAPFATIAAREQIIFLGYAPDTSRYQEWYGFNYGWQGVNMWFWRHTGLLEFYDVDGTLVARAEVYEYPPWH